MVKVYCNGVFDLCHPGHINFFKESSKYGDLYVGVHRDEDAEMYKRRPYMTYKERCSIVKECKYVKDVIPDTDLEITEEFIRKNQIDIVTCGQIDEKWHKDPIRMNIIYEIRRYESISTTEIISRIEARIK